MFNISKDMTVSDIYRIFHRQIYTMERKEVIEVCKAIMSAPGDRETAIKLARRNRWWIDPEDALQYEKTCPYHQEHQLHSYVTLLQSIPDCIINNKKLCMFALGIEMVGSLWIIDDPSSTKVESDNIELSKGDMLLCIDTDEAISTYIKVKLCISRLDMCDSYTLHALHDMVFKISDLGNARLRQLPPQLINKLFNRGVVSCEIEDEFVAYLDAK